MTGRPTAVRRYGSADRRVSVRDYERCWAGIGHSDKCRTGRVWPPGRLNNMRGTTERIGELRVGGNRCGERREIVDELV